MSDLYDADILLWSEQQADLLRRAATGERVNGLDWANIVEEIESVGRSELHAVEGLLEQALLHLMKLHGWPDSPASNHWTVEVAALLGRAGAQFVPSMAQRLELQKCFRRARRLVSMVTIGGEPPRALPLTCPFTLAELLDEDADPAALAARLADRADG